MFEVGGLRQKHGQISILYAEGRELFHVDFASNLERSGPLTSN